MPLIMLRHFEKVLEIYFCWVKKKNLANEIYQERKMIKERACDWDLFS